MVMGAVAALLVVAAIGGFVMSKGTPPPIGLVEGNLRPCPSSPNCVSSQAKDTAHRVAPLAFSGDPAAAMARARAVIEGMPRTKVVLTSSTYLHAEMTTALFRFTDDVELLLDQAAHVIHIRSASRVGYSDLGKNRSRVEEIRKKFEGP